MILKKEDAGTHRLLVLVATLSFLLLTLAIIAVYLSPMEGYEYSVYESTPLVFWIAIITGLAVGILLFVVYYGKSRAMWGLGLFQILFSNYLLVSFYQVKGFMYIDRFDSMSIVGYAKDIVQSGHFPGTNYYPMGSIMMASTGELVDQSVILMSQLFPALMFTAYMLGMLCWARAISDHPLFAPSMMVASLPILFAGYIPTIMHQTMMVMMLPLFFYILWRCGESNRYKVLAAVMIVFFTLGHPLVAVGIVVILATIIITEALLKRPVRTVTPPLLLLSILALFIWVFSNAVLTKNVEANIEMLLGVVEGRTTIGAAQGTASQLGILWVLQSMLACVIDDIIYAIMAIAVGVMIFKRRSRPHLMTVVMACFLAGTIFFGATALLTYAHNINRIINLNFIMIFAVPLVGYLLFTYRKDGKRVLTLLVTVLIAISLVATVFAVYSDPMQKTPNGSISRSDVAGANWFINERPELLRTHILQSVPWRFADMIYGAEYNKEHLAFRWNINATTAHFASYYNSSDRGDSDYLVFSTFDVDAYTRTWTPINKFTVDDFVRLDRVEPVGNIYNNGCWMVYWKT